MVQIALKGIAAVLLLLAIVFSLFWSAPSVSPRDEGKIHIQLWRSTGQNEEEAFSVTKFNQVQERIAVESVAIPWQEHEKKVLTAILSGNPPDLIFQFSPVAQLASRRALLPLDELIRRDHFDSTVFFPALWREMKWQGHTFAIPVQTASYALFYNKRLFREAGLDPENPPQTWEEVKRFSKALFKKDAAGRIVRMGFIPEYGFLPQHGDLPTAILIAWQLGAEILRDHGATVSLTNRETVAALEWVVNFLDDYSYEEVAAFSAGFGYAEQHAFLAEKVAMMILASHFTKQIAQYCPNLDYGVAMIPTVEGYPTASASGSFWLAIPRGARHPEAAWEYMKFTVSKKIQLQGSQEMDEPLFPANRLAARDRQFIQDSSTAVFVKQMDYAHSPAIVPLVHGVFWREYTTAREMAVNGVLSPREALARAERLIQLELDKAWRYDRYVRSKMSFETEIPKN